MAGIDQTGRLAALLAQSDVTGIDFVQVVDPADQTRLRVFFLINVDKLDDPIVNTADLPVDVPPETVRIERLPDGDPPVEVPITGATYRQVSAGDQMRTVLDVRTAEPGDFSIYRLTIFDEPSHRIDRFFNGIEFSFKQGCPSRLDCQPPPLECPPEATMDIPIDYLARDFVSLRHALLDFAAQRYPQWTETIEADAGVMLAEVMAALGDELSYIQDRYAREGYLETATQRRSLRRHTRLVDYHIHDGSTPTTVLDLRVNPSVSGGTGGIFVEAGRRVWAHGQGEAPIPFELGDGLADTTADDGNPRRFWIHETWNELPVHVPDSGDPCLPVGATELFLRGTVPTASQVPPDEDPERFWIGKWLLLRTDPADPSLPARRYLVRIVSVEQTTDPLILDDQDPPQPVEITKIQWEENQALPVQMCLEDMVVHGNLVPATAGETLTEVFTIGSNSALAPALLGAAPPAVERQGPLDAVACQRSPVFLYSLAQTESRGLGWLGPLRHAKPELELQEVSALDLEPLIPQRFWRWRRSLLDARGFEDAFTLDDGTWRRVIGFRRPTETIEHLDYAGGSGFTVRFGDGEFGKVPPDGTVFRARYRTGPGPRGNVPADTIVHVVNPLDETQADLAGILDGVTNPLPVSNGLPREEAVSVKQQAPEAFRAVTFRAVRPEDYAEIAERLPWVQRSGARFRWTGSWLTTFVTADPRGAFGLSPERRTELEALMDGVRQAGRDVVVSTPRYVNLDLEVTVCVEPFAYAGQVKARILEAFLGRKGVHPTKGFFHPDHFTFGTPLRRAALEAAIQDVTGVRAVETIRLRARGITDWFIFEALSFEVSHDQIIRLQHDPRLPERGSLRVVTRLEEASPMEHEP